MLLNLQFMKRFSLVFATVLLCLCKAGAQTSHAEQAASRLTQRLSDSLSLTAVQKANVYDVNLTLNSQKLQVIQQYPNRDSARSRLLTLERQRDSLYRPVFTAAQFQMYQAKKATLLGQ